jgi:hypothetical protein
MLSEARRRCPIGGVLRRYVGGPESECPNLARRGRLRGVADGAREGGRPSCRAPPGDVDGRRDLTRTSAITMPNPLLTHLTTATLPMQLSHTGDVEASTHADSGESGPANPPVATVPHKRPLPGRGQLRLGRHSGTAQTPSERPPKACRFRPRGDRPLPIAPTRRGCSRPLAMAARPK